MSVFRNWSANNGEYLLKITDKVWQTLDTECLNAKGVETGGIVIGYYSDDQSTAVITEATPPPKDSLFGAFSFGRGISGLKSLLVRRWKNTILRTYYLGEWHYHPTVQITPSGIDVQQMLSIGQMTNYHCKKPIMLILGDKKAGARQIRAFVYPNGQQFFEYLDISDNISC